jgi:hypothetical protein
VVREEREAVSGRHSFSPFTVGAVIAEIPLIPITWFETETYVSVLPFVITL